MCTLSWWRSGSQLDVFFNRDERRSRSRASPPARRKTADGTAYLSPTDPDGGGTWMLANDHGIVICLLNRWHEGGAASPRESRGRLVDALAAEASPCAVGRRLDGMDVTTYLPFTLVALAADDGEAAWSWDGRVLAGETPHPPLTSSSFAFPEVRAAREALHGRILAAAGEGAEVEALHRFHGGDGAAATAFTPRMCREDAQTWSRSEVRVTAGEIRWRYLEEPVDLVGAPLETVIALARQPPPPPPAPGSAAPPRPARR